MSCPRWVTLVLSFLVACGEAPTAATDGGDGGVVVDGGAEPADAAVIPLDPEVARWLMDGPASPVDLSVDVDETRAIDAVVGVEGGSFTVTAEDGTRFELSVPPRAVFNDTPIHMAPIRALGGLPAELSEAHAVQLGPEGLSFFELVSLRIVTPTTVAVAEVVPFGFHADGEGMFLTHRGASAEDAVVLLDHFSGYGAARGAILDSPEFVRTMGRRMEDRFRTQLAWERMRANRLLPAETNRFPPLSEIDSFYRFYRDRMITGTLAIGVFRCDAALDTLAQMTGFVHDRYLVGIPEEVPELLSDLAPLIPYVVDVTRTCLMEEYELCTGDQHIVHRMLPMWRGLRHQALLYGMEGTMELDQLDTIAEELLDMCLRFDLEFISDAETNEPGAGGYHTVVRATVRVHLAPENIESGEHMLQGRDPLVHTLFVFTLDGCTVTSHAGAPAQFDVDDLILHTTPYIMMRERGTLEAITLRYFPGVTGESYMFVCPGPYSFSSPPEGLWTGSYLTAHMSELDETTSLFETVDWTLGTDPIGYKSWNVPSDGYLTEAGSFTLDHRPGG